MTDLPDVAFKILSRADWRTTLAEGAYDGSPVDHADGYIHLSAADQLAVTAAKHYAGQSDLMLVEVDLDRVAGGMALHRAVDIEHALACGDVLRGEDADAGDGLMNGAGERLGC